MGRTARERAAAVVIAVGIAALVAATPAAAQLNIAIEARATLLAKSYTASAQQVFGALAAKPGNIVLSPYSIGTAMAMALTGARGDTAGEMAKVLTHRMAREAIDTANAEMLKILRGYDHSGDPPSCPAGATLTAGNCQAPPRGTQCLPGMRLDGGRCVGEGTLATSAKLLAANALMAINNGDLISGDYADTLKTRYGAEIFRDATPADINSWVSRMTEGKIAKLVDSLDGAPAAVLLNAIYFKAAWANAFNKAATRNESFSLSRSQTVEVPMMHETGTFSLVSRGGYRAIRLPYAVPEIGMIVVLPDDIEGVDGVARRLEPNELADLFALLRGGRRAVALALPRFRAQYQADLAGAFEAAGMRKAFDAQAADFSGMTGRPVAPGTLHIGNIIHAAVIEANEEATEAAAATAIMMPRSAVAGPRPEEFRVDRPFLFYIVEDSTGVILFQGRIADPR